MSEQRYLFDITKNKHKGNKESKEANLKILSSKAKVRRKIMRYAVDKDVKGFIADRIAADWDCFHSHVSPRISELKAMGLLVETRKRRRTRSGCWARVLVTARVAAREKLKIRKRKVDDLSWNVMDE